MRSWFLFFFEVSKNVRKTETAVNHSVSVTESIMKRMKIALIDDEEDARVILRTLLKSQLPFEGIQEASGVSEGLKLIRTYQPDIVFLDVMMKDGTGFDLLNQLPQINFKLVIVSGRDDFALKAFRFSAVDYLLKPVDIEELKVTISRIINAPVAPWQQMMEVLRQNVQPVAETDRKIILKDANAVYVVAVNSIIRCEAFDNYTTFHFTDQAPIIVSRSLKEFDEMLGAFRFLRVHQSHLLNLIHVKQFNKKDGGSITMKDGSELPIAQRKRDFILQELSRLT